MLISENLLAQSDVGITDNDVLDQFTIPFGTWIEQAVNWTTLNLDWLLDAIAWPFEFLLKNLVDNFLLEIPWVVLVGMMFLIAWLVRNLTVATGTAIGLTICGLLGPAYWEQTARTIGFIAVAVLVCVVIGIPVGILAGRIDSVWKVVRPTLDAMQVIHAFVYLLPFVYFWGVGRVAATMATMVFALPPLIRLTNLGIRGVPEDVVEASRAYGAPELRVLMDVQLPLARPAIMTGINQTLLLAFSMLGIAAILGAGGLGQLLFRALGQQDVSLAAASGFAFFILAVILDRISQTSESGGTGLFRRMAKAWKARSNPEILLDDPSFNPDAQQRALVDRLEPELSSLSVGRIADVDPPERTSIAIAGFGGLVMIVSIFLTWANDASLLTGYSRRGDEDLAGRSFSGLAAEGGSWFAYSVAAMGIFIVVACLVVYTRWQGGGRWLAPDGALYASLGGLVAAFSYLVASPSPATVEYSDGIGVYVAVGGGLLALAGSLRWTLAAPYGPRRPLKSHVVFGPIVLGVGGVLLALISMFSSWTLDERADAVITPEIQAQIDEVRRQAAAGEIEPGVAATEIIVIRSSAVTADRIVVDGKSSDGAGLGIWTLVFATAGALSALVCAGAAGLGDRRQWLAGGLTMGFGVGVTLIAIGWIGSLARATDAGFTSGVGSMVGALAGMVLYAAGSSVVSGFERSNVYDEVVTIEELLEQSAEPRPEVVSSGL